VRCAESHVTVRLRRAGEDWYTPNRYEVKVDTVGVGGGGVWFRHEFRILPDGRIQGTGRWVAPAGTEYEIRSVRTGAGAAALY
jgi:hypothetical protein